MQLNVADTATLLAFTTAAAVGWLTWLIFTVYLKGQSMASIPRVPRQSGLLGFLLGDLFSLADFHYHRTGFRWTQQCGEYARLRVLWTQVCIARIPGVQVPPQQQIPVHPTCNFADSHGC